MASPLEGIRVADLTRLIAGPCATQILGDLGAEVIKIEPPEGDGQRFAVGPGYAGESFHFMAFNRNKRSVILDLSTPSGKQAFYDLVKVSDVVVDNFRPGAMKRLGADYETLKKVNPKIITCSITGWGESGPYSHRPSLDVMMLGYAGFLDITGQPDGPPTKPGEAVGDQAAAVFATIGVLAALHRRSVTGVGSKVDVSLLESIMAFMNYSFLYYFLGGVPPKRIGSQHPSSIPYGVFKTKNGYVTIAGSWPRIARVINAEWMMDDPRFKERTDRVAHRAELNKIVEERLSHADTEDWVNIFEAEDIVGGPVNSIDQVAADKQVQHQEAIIKLKHQKGGEVKFVGCPIKMTGLSPEKYVTPPLLGEHTDEVLGTVLGYSKEQIARIKKEQEDNTAERQSHVQKRR